ncbi:hypothetical protein A6A04_19440 [Paramagnetospirillum marisnigri]|uniref:Cyclic nucleotide-binding domain-containing protein n=1 Tax=Paramagnetospirillum marisnigri TaxID=1285242 RepID=A0A178MMY8_9PROT|nr:Crp/Fnr family transcriptional regulator [Paramagnetospirillum marisnigri]OAN49458.1 hypothetical protein A6A04_19440 [Paramagnetospirillum marisnigri]
MNGNQDHNGPERQRRKLAQERCREVIGALDLFSSVAPGDLDDLCRTATLRTYLHHAEIYGTDSPSGSLFIVERGAVLLGCACEPPESKKIAIHWIDEGGIFGEMEFLEADDEFSPLPNRQMRAEAASDCAVIALEGRTIRKLIRQYMDLERRLHRIVARRHRRSIDVIERMAFIGMVEIRLAQAVMERAKAVGIREDGVIRMPPRITHQQLGDLLAVDRRSVLETLRLWQDADIVRHDNLGVLTVLDPRSLDAIAAMRSGQRKSWEAETWLALIDADMARGYNAQAFDLARDALRRPSLSRHPQLRHRMVLACARAGARHQAIELLKSFKFDHCDDDVDIASLEPRLLKDMSLSAIDEVAARHLALQSAERYLAIYERTGNHYPGINAATMFAMAGDQGKAIQTARSILNSEVPVRTYYAAATRAEAATILGEYTLAEREFALAMGLPDANPGAVATTRRQLRMLARTLGIPPTDFIMRVAPQSPVLVYQGDAPNLETCQNILKAHRPKWGFGSLVSTSDIVMAEAMIREGCELHLVLPNRGGEFLSRSIGPKARHWVSRFNHCLEHAHRVFIAAWPMDRTGTAMEYPGHRLSVGLAMRHAAELEANCILLSGNTATTITASLRTAESPDHAAISDFIDRHLGHETFVQMVYCSWNDGDMQRATQLLQSLHWTGPEFWLSETEIVLAPSDAAALAVTLSAAAHRLDVPLRIICDIAPVAETHAVSASTCVVVQAKPVLPANIPLATELFMAETSLSPTSSPHGQYVGRLQTKEGYGTFRVYALS